MLTSHCKHPPSPTSVMECHKGFDHCSSGISEHEAGSLDDSLQFGNNETNDSHVEFTYRATTDRWIFIPMSACELPAKTSPIGVKKWVGSSSYFHSCL